jgi:hypothetical protein
MTIYNSIASHMTSIFKAIGEESKLLFTSRKTVYVEAKRLKSFVTGVLEKKAISLSNR